MIIEINEEHSEALEAINESYYQNDDLGKTVEHMIREDVMREGGMLGRFVDEHYDPEWRSGVGARLR